MPEPIESVGEEVVNAQTARDDGANVQNPSAPPTVLQPDGRIERNFDNAPSNADRPEDDRDIGLDAPTRTVENTQSNTTPFDGPPQPGLGGNPSGSYTRAAASDDNVRMSNTSVVGQVAQMFGAASESLAPTPNILDKCSSYTYNFSLYMLTPQQYQRILSNKRKSVAGLSLLMASGGYPNARPVTASESETTSGNQTLGVPGTGNSGRSQFFPLDYYIDNVQVKTLLNGKGTASSHSVTELSFKIIEPNGITFFDNLAAATNNLAVNAGDGQNSFVKQLYLMVIRFYGYDQNGNLVTPSRETSVNQSDQTALTEKFIPFVFKDIKFKVYSGLPEYDCTAVCPQNFFGTGQQRGVIPYNIQLTSNTLNDLLMNDLKTALNSYQQQLVKDQIFTYADEYDFKLLPPLNSSTISVVPPGELKKSSTGMAPPTGRTASPVDGKKQSVQGTTKNNSAVAGMSIVQFIDQQVRTSGYIYQQQLKIYNPKTDEEEIQSSPGKLMAWYRISTQAEALPGKWDPKRGDFAYKITYQVAPYLVTDVLSDYFPQSPRWTPPKQYFYWFTGKNNAILDYVQELNNLYFVVVNTAQQAFSESALKNASTKGYQPNSNQSSQGTTGRVNEPGANAANSLYSPSDLRTVKMTIVGDPDWIQQGDLWAGISGDNFSPSTLLPDGTINYESREVLFDVIFNRPADYNLNTGLIDLPGSEKQQKANELRTRYKATTVTHNFRQGRFTQDIEGVCVYPNTATALQLKNKKQAQPSSSAASTVFRQATQADVRIIDNAIAAARDTAPNQQPTSALGKATQQVLNPPSALPEPTLSQLQASPVYIQARRDGATPRAALDAARSAFASGTNNYEGSALPGIRTGANRGLVKDGNPG